MYRKSPTKFERKFQCKIFHGRPLLVQVPKIRTSPNASFWLIWPNWDMKGMEMWPKAIMVWKYDGSRPTRPKIAEVSSPGPEIWFFYKKNQWFAIKPTVQHIENWSLTTHRVQRWDCTLHSSWLAVFVPARLVTSLNEQFSSTSLYWKLGEPPKKTCFFEDIDPKCGCLELLCPKSHQNPSKSPRNLPFLIRISPFVVLKWAKTLGWVCWFTLLGSMS